MNVASTVRTPLTSTGCVYGDYLVFLNSSEDGTNVTVVNPVNVTSYVIDGKAEVLQRLRSSQLHQQLQSSAADAFGIPAETVDLGFLPPSYHPSVQVFAQGTKYYVVEEVQTNNVTTVNVTVVNAANLMGSPLSSTTTQLSGTGQNVISPHGMSRAY